MLELVQLSSMENIMPKVKQEFTPIRWIGGLKGERLSYQIAFRTDSTGYYKIEVESDIKEHLKVYKIGNVPVTRAFFNYKAKDDDNYISHDGGMYPDILYPLTTDTIRGQYHYQGIWIETDANVAPGKYKVKFSLYDDNDFASTVMNIEVLNTALPPQKLLYQVSLHSDCISTWYKKEVFSQEYWQLLDKYLKVSADYGSNAINVPLFTPPLDTKVGGERPTVQLVEVYKEGDKYTFDFANAQKYIDMCKKNGMTHFVITPFFTQWGAEFTPKIMIHENGEIKKCFGWSVKSTDESYLNLLRQFFPEMNKFIEKNSIENNTIVMISDEPFDDETIKRYAFLKEFMTPYVKNYKIMDAFTNYKHFKAAGADVPVIPTTCINDFMGKVSDIWVYYCCAQDYKVSNRFITMPLYRNRSFGYQLYKYNVSIFFHWAINFWYAQLAVRELNPFYETDSDGGFPAGDAFTVYPGEDGPIISMRTIAFSEALQDLRALQLLEEKIGRDETIKLIENITGEVTFENCAKNVQTMLSLREVIFWKLKECKQ